MNIIQSPNIYETRLNVRKRLFLAGGISNCPDWQKDLTDRFWKFGDAVAIFNPRREGGLCKEGDEAKAQIKWENWHLHQATHLLFWFPEETLCPISLFELGKWVSNYLHTKPCARYNLSIGCHPNYQRKFDVEIQMSLIDEFIKVENNIDDLFENACEKLGIK
jgi:hypothetical protein